MSDKPKLQVLKQKAYINIFLPTKATAQLIVGITAPKLSPWPPPLSGHGGLVALVITWALLLTLYLCEKHIQQRGPFPVCRTGMNRITPYAAATESNSIWHCARICDGIKEAKLSCCFLSNPVTVLGGLFPTGSSPSSLHIKVQHTQRDRKTHTRAHTHMHTRTHTPRPQAWNFYKEQYT